MPTGGRVTRRHVAGEHQHLPGVSRDSSQGNKDFEMVWVVDLDGAESTGGASIRNPDPTMGMTPCSGVPVPDKEVDPSA